MPVSEQHKKPIIHLPLRMLGRTVKFKLHSMDEHFAPSEPRYLLDLADYISTLRAEAEIKRAIAKIEENHYAEHLKIHPDATLSLKAFREGLSLVQVDLWTDGSIALLFDTTKETLSGRQIEVSFMKDRPAYTSNIPALQKS